MNSGQIHIVWKCVIVFTVNNLPPVSNTTFSNKKIHDLTVGEYRNNCNIIIVYSFKM